VSIGVAALGTTWERTTGSQLTDLLAGADRALYQAKKRGPEPRLDVHGHRNRGGPARPRTAASLILYVALGNLPARSRVSIPRLV